VAPVLIQTYSNRPKPDLNIWWECPFQSPSQKTLFLRLILLVKIRHRFMWYNLTQGVCCGSGNLWMSSLNLIETRKERDKITNVGSAYLVHNFKCITIFYLRIRQILSCDNLIVWLFTKVYFNWKFVNHNSDNLKFCSISSLIFHIWQFKGTVTWDFCFQQKYPTDPLICLKQFRL
jgi:hypothetical protein